MSARRFILLSGALAACLCLTLPGWAHADRYELTLGSAARIMHSTSMDALSDNEMPVFSMTGAVAIDRVQLPLVHRFAIEGGFDAGAVSGNSFQTLDTRTSFMHWTLGARVSRDLNRRVTVHGRAALGLARVGVTIDDSFMAGPSLGDSGYTGTGYAGAAGDVYLLKPGPTSPTLITLGLRMELGYLAVVPRTMTARPDGSDHEDGAILIPETSAPLGSLNLSAVNVRLGLVGRF